LLQTEKVQGSIERQPVVTSSLPGPAGDPSLRDAAEVAADLGVDPAVGLSAAEASRRLARDGANELRSASSPPTWRRILAQLQDPLVYLLFVAVLISIVAWIAEGAHGLPVDAVVVTAVLALNTAIGFLQERRAEQAIAALASMTAASSSVLRDGRIQSLPSADLVRGDILLLREGDRVGADARLLEANVLRVAEASLTGESESVSKSSASLSCPAPLGERADMVFRGTSVVQGVGRAVVTDIGMDTEMGSIAELLEETRDEPSPLQREMAEVGRVLGIAVITIAILVMLVTALVNEISSLHDFGVVLLLGVSLAVAAVPEGLPAILSIVLAIGVQRMARRHAVVKTLHSVEALGSASVIASDKTGTLTQNEMTIQRIRTASGEVELSGIGYRPWPTTRS
jgi:Ca2+-transporting ATPase